MFRPNVAAQRKIRRLEVKVLDLTAEIDARDRTIRVLEQEVQTLALVIARDRQRVQAEAAEMACRRAAAEGGRDG